MKLQRPLVVLDLETTGTWVEKDRIIEIGMIKCHPDGVETTYDKRVNPGMAIPAIVTEVTGIRQEDVKTASYFRDLAKEILAFIGDADLAGFNLERFDLPVLERECKDSGYAFEWQKRTIYDAQKIYHLHERRDLTAAYAFYCHKDLAQAHSALADSQATLEVLESQLIKYGKGSEQIDALAEFDYKKQTEFFDSERRFRWWNGELYMLFGKYARKKSLKEVAQEDRGYLEWILSQKFNDEVKVLVENALEGKFPSQDAGG